MTKKDVKKITIGSLAGIAAIATPIVTVISCGKDEDTKKVDSLVEVNLNDKIETLNKEHFTKIEAYKTALIKLFDGTFADDKETAFAQNAFDEIKNATTGAAALAAAKKIVAYGKTTPGVKETIQIPDFNGTIESLSEYKTRLKGLFTGKFKDNKGTSFVDSDFSNITNAQDAAAAKAAAETLANNVFGAYTAEANTIVTVDGVQKDLGKFSSNLNVTTKTPGKAAVTEKLAQAVAKSVVDGELDAAQNKAAILAILNKYTSDNKNTQMFSETTITAIKEAVVKLTVQKDTAKTMFTDGNIFDKTYVKAVQEVKTVVTIDSKDHTLNKYTANTTLKVETAGSAAEAETKATPETQGDFETKIDQATDEAGILAILGDYTSDDTNKTPLVETTVTGAADLSAKQIAAKALFGGGIYKKDYKAPKNEVNTIVSIDGETIDLGSFVNAPTSTVKTPGNAEITEKLAQAVTKATVDNEIEQATDEAGILAVLQKYTSDNKNTSAFDGTNVQNVDGAAETLIAQIVAAKALFTDGNIFDKTYVKAAQEEETVLTVDGVDINLGKFVASPATLATATTPGNAETLGVKETITVPDLNKTGQTEQDYKDALIKLFDKKFSDANGTKFTSVELDTIKNAASHTEAKTAAETLANKTYGAPQPGKVLSIKIEISLVSLDEYKDKLKELFMGLKADKEGKADVDLSTIDNATTKDEADNAAKAIKAFGEKVTSYSEHSQAIYL
ncbi:hypothetical protein [Mycoplasma todarodis]|uniref:hypothetical protein n=1 Tax=Mycoplasma todarodis TaxID=1937191 RepID=UPI003B312EBD